MESVTVSIQIKKNAHMNLLLNVDEGNIKSVLLRLFETKRTVDEQIISIY